jgi:abortive infection bacteriophage resistance protein
METFTKPPRSADEHLKLLLERNLKVSDSEEVEIKRYLRSQGYFRLSEYFGPLQNETKDKFEDGTTFEDIKRLYVFDNKLKSLTLEALRIIEIELRARLTDVYSMVYDSYWYGDFKLFKDQTEWIDTKTCSIEDGVLVERIERVQTSSYKKLSDDIKQSVDKIEHSDFLKKFREKYTLGSPLPSWMVMESISFGRLSILFSLLKNTDLKKKIADHFGAVTSDHLVSWLHGLVILRNISAHHARLWNKKIKDVRMPDRERHKFIKNVNDENIRKYFGIASCMLKMLQEINIDFKKEFILTLLGLMSEYKIDPHAMGFPDNFQENTIWMIKDIK